MAHSDSLDSEWKWFVPFEFLRWWVQVRNGSPHEWTVKNQNGSKSNSKQQTIDDKTNMSNQNRDFVLGSGLGRWSASRIQLKVAMQSWKHFSKGDSEMGTFCINELVVFRFWMGIYSSLPHFYFRCGWQNHPISENDLITILRQWIPWYSILEITGCRSTF